MKGPARFESSLHHSLEKYENLGFSCGLLLGQESEKSEYILHVTRIPKELKHTDEVNSKFVLDHMRNILQILPGGVTIVGLLLVGADSKVLLSAGAINKFKEIISTINLFLEENERCTEKKIGSKLLFHYVNSNNIICKRFLSSKSGNPFESAEYTFEPLIWHKINCYYDFEQMPPLYVNSVSSDVVNDKLMSIWKMVDHDLQNSKLLLNGKLRNDSELLADVKDEQSKQISKSEDCSFMIVDIYSANTNSDVKSVGIFNYKAEFKLHGSLCSEVYLHENATVKEAIQAVKDDILRSIYSRLSMHCTSLTDEITSSEDEIIHEPPRRVSVKLPHSSVRFTDYLFPGEEFSSLHHIKEILNLDPTEDDNNIFQVLEAETDVSSFSKTKPSDSSFEMKIIKKRKHNYSIMIAVAFSFFVILFAVFFHRIRST